MSDKPPGAEKKIDDGSIASVPMAQSDPGARANAERAVKGPAIAMIVTALLNIAVAIVLIAMACSTALENSARHQPHAEKGSVAAFREAVNADFEDKPINPLAMFGNVFTIMASAFVLYGGLKMKKLESRGLCLGTVVVAMIPFITILWYIGFPLGFWAFVVLNKLEIKKHFI